MWKRKKVTVIELNQPKKIARQRLLPLLFANIFCEQKLNAPRFRMMLSSGSSKPEFNVVFDLFLTCTLTHLLKALLVRLSWQLPFALLSESPRLCVVYIVIWDLWLLLSKNINYIVWRIQFAFGDAFLGLRFAFIIWLLSVSICKKGYKKKKAMSETDKSWNEIVLD